MSEGASRTGSRGLVSLEVGGVEIQVFSDEGPSLAELGLSAAEQEIVRLVLTGATNAEIAALRGRSPRTVAKQVSACLRRLGVASRAELIARITVGGSDPER